MSDFHRVLLGLHARARRIDRDQALLGALGVGAIAYIHQIDNVHRMMTATSCRWLLADEVGLGKTIQAIMVMRALAAQSPQPLNVALVVPDDLTSQWAEELVCRGHILPIEVGQDGGVTGNTVLRLARPSRLSTGGRLAADKIDLLIVDEFTKLQTQVRRDLITAAHLIPNVIVLTATPSLHLPAMRRELMSLIEPEAERIARAETRDILTVLAEREAHAIERHGNRLQNAATRRAVEESYGLYRHLIRTVRSDYPDALPKRAYQPIRVAPTDGDVERTRTTRAYLDAAKTSNVEIRRDLLLQVAGRSAASLRDRVSTLPRPSPELQGARQRIDRCLREERGDAKLDALIDHLRAVHARNPDARVVVVAEDNPTTDYLRDAIEKLADVKVAKKRRSVSAAEELDEQVTTLKEALDDFISGEAKVLVATDAAREGYNLQFSDEIIFFALPWSPHDIQQWIGRIDRLGTKGMPANRVITITPIVTENSIEEKILQAIEETRVFLRSEVFDEAEWKDISDAIGAAAEGKAGASWKDAARHAEVLGVAYDSWLRATKLPPTPRAVVACHCDTRFRARPYALPMAEVKGYAWNWYVMRERAANDIVKLAREDYLDIRKGLWGQQRFRTMWYKSRPGPDDLTLPDLDTRSPWYHQAFISKRSALECPPQTHVVQDDGKHRQLHFFDHGCSLHDGAIAAFEQQTPATDIQTEFIVEYPAGHPALQWAGRRLLIAVSELDLCGAITFDIEEMLGVADADASKPEQEARKTASRIASAQFQADRRWMVDLASPELLVAVLVEEGDSVIPVNDAVPALLNPFHNGSGARQIGMRRAMLSETRVAVVRTGARNRLQALAQDHLSRATTCLRKEVKARLFAAQADAENLVSAAQAELAATAALDSKFEFNRATQRGAALMLEMAQATGRHRLAHLQGLADAMEQSALLMAPKLFWVVPRAPIQQTP